MSRRFSSSSSNLGDAISILRLTKSGGCVDRDESYMRQARQAQVRNYFFGNAKTALSPHTQVVDADTLVVFRMGDRKFTPNPTFGFSVCYARQRLPKHTPDSLLPSKRRKRRPPPPRRRARRNRRQVRRVEPLHPPGESYTGHAERHTRCQARLCFRLCGNDSRRQRHGICVCSRRGRCEEEDPRFESGRRTSACESGGLGRVAGGGGRSCWVRDVEDGFLLFSGQDIHPCPLATSRAHVNWLLC